MQSTNHHKKFASKKLKQVKVDNWGTFFLQRLLQLYFNEELLDLNIKFHTSNNVIKVHRLVVTTCTDYFAQLEREQSESTISNNDTIMMPDDMPYECVKSIISFMYTGQLEYWIPEQNDLYQTAQKMNMSVLTKLLDAQLNSYISENTTGKEKINESQFSTPKQSMINLEASSLFSSQAVSAKKSSAWRTNLDGHSTLLFSKNFSDQYDTYSEGNYSIEAGRPSRFDLPEIEELTLGVFSSFDDITYNTKPIIQAPTTTKSINDKKDIQNFDGNMIDMFPSLNDSSNITKLNQMDCSSDDEWLGLDSVLKFDDEQPPKKKLMLNLDERQYLPEDERNYSISKTGNFIDGHAKIIREVLKKYPHLVQHNKNIRLKIMQKESKNNDCSTSGKTKISYVFLKSESLMVSSSDELDLFSKGRGHHSEVNEVGPWKCNSCNLDEQYLNYYMYRRHMQDVHNEKFDPRICEHCGYRATKRNILMYHLYTKHNVAPPKSMSFPKCHMCSYIALSESLLLRHQINHKHQAPIFQSENITKDGVQYVECEKKDFDVSELEYHELSFNHRSSLRDKNKKHYCLYCNKCFENYSTLKVHINNRHKKLTKRQRPPGMPFFSNQTSKKTSCAPISNCLEKSLNVEEDLKLSKINETDEVPNASLDNEFPISLSNNKIVVHSSNGNIIFYVEHAKNFESSQKLNTKCNYNQDSLNDTEIVEVVEELEATEDEEQKQELDFEQDKKLKAIKIKDTDTCHNDDHFDSKILGTPSVGIKEVVQYIEEETEILEYETCATD